jgi:hypothetical protein
LYATNNDFWYIIRVIKPEYYLPKLKKRSLMFALSICITYTHKCISIPLLCSHFTQWSAYNKHKNLLTIDNTSIADFLSFIQLSKNVDKLIFIKVIGGRVLYKYTPIFNSTYFVSTSNHLLTLKNEPIIRVFIRSISKIMHFLFDCDSSKHRHFNIFAKLNIINK